MPDLFHRAANRGSISTASYDIGNSCRSEANESESMTKDCAATVTAERKTFTLSFWVKRSKFGSDPMFICEFGETDYNQTGRTYLRFDDDQLQMGAGNTYWFKTERLFRDASAWYHIVLAVDTTDGTAGDRHKVYVNGVRETDWDTVTNPTQNLTHAFSLNENHSIGRSHVDNGSYFDGYMAEFHAVGGAQLAPTEFGEFDSASGIWKPIEYTGTSGTGSTGWGTNGWYLDFADSDNLGDDEKSGGTVLDFTENGIAATNQTTDSPTNNFCTLNAVANNNYDSPSGNLEMGGCRIQTPASGWTTWLSTMPFSAGKWYIEFEDMGTYAAFGIMNVDKTHLLYEGTGAEGVAYRTWNSGALARDGNDQVSAGLGAPDSNNWVWGFWIDMDNGKFSVANRDGSTGTVLDEVDIGNCLDNGRMVIPFVRHHANTDTNINFGNGRWRSDNMMGWYASFSHNGYQDDNGYGNFEYSPNANSKSYYALCTKNLAEFGG